MTETAPQPKPITDSLSISPTERLVRSMCSQCWNGCGIVVHVEGVVVTRIEGDPDNPHNHGVICAKGQVGPQGLYSPYRVRRPLIRTNPEKGLEVDPKWRETTWDEALDMITERLSKLRKDDPRKLLFSSFDTSGGPILEYQSWLRAYGSPNFTPNSADYFCGNSVHTMHFLNQAAFHGGVDFKYCKFILQIGTQWGSVLNTNILGATKDLAEARAFERIRTVVVDPWSSFAGSKADEWVPIRPGTDAAFILSLVNVMINELGRYDEHFLKYKSNAPYLIGEDKLYFKDEKAGKPLVWDSRELKPKAFDDASIGDYALLGEYVVNGKKCKTAFQILKEHVAKYTPEWVSEVTSIPKETIRKIAKEWVDEARIGETIHVNGFDLPYRPVAVNWYRGTSAHKHSAAIGYAIMLLPTLVGAIDVPGGAMGEWRMPFEWISEDGMLATKSVTQVSAPYPPRKVTPPNSAFYFELFPIAPYSPVMIPLTHMKPEKYKLPYKIEAVIQLRNNFVKSSGPTDVMVDWIKQVPFVVSFSTVVDETATMSDVILPDLYYLEREGLSFFEADPGIEGTKFQYLQQQAVKPPFDPPYDSITGSVDMLLEIAERVGFLDEFYEDLNSTYRLREELKLRPRRKYTWSEILDRRLANIYGTEHNLEWFKKNQVISIPKDVPFAYPGAFRKSRVHLYYEFVQRAGNEVDRITRELGIPWETSDYQPLPDWKPCPSFNPKSKEFDLWIINSKLPTHTLSGSIYYPALLSITSRHMLDRGVLVNADTASRKGIRYGDWVTIETQTGKKARARALVSEVCHPEVIVCFGSHGRRSTPNTSARGIGIDFNQLLELDEEHIDFVDGALDSCIRVKVSKEDS